MTQSLSKIGVQFVADMSDMVSKMSGMSAYTKKWAKETAAMTNIGGPSGAEQLARLNVSRGMSEQGRQERLQKEAEAERKLSVQKLTDARMLLRNIRQLENNNIQAREEAERKLAVSRVTSSRLMINQIRAMEEAALQSRQEIQRKELVDRTTASRLMINKIRAMEEVALQSRQEIERKQLVEKTVASRLMINQIRQMEESALQSRQEIERKELVGRITASRLMINQIRQMEQSALQSRQEIQRKELVDRTTSSRLMINQIRQMEESALQSRQEIERKQLVEKTAASRLMINQIRQMEFDAAEERRLMARQEQVDKTTASRLLIRQIKQMESDAFRAREEAERRQFVSRSTASRLIIRQIKQMESEAAQIREELERKLSVEKATASRLVINKIRQMESEAAEERRLIARQEQVDRLTASRLTINKIRQMESEAAEERRLMARQEQVDKTTASRLVINQIRQMEESAIALRAESERKNAVRLQTSSRLIIRQITQQQLAAIAAKDAADRASFLAAQTRTRLLINQIKQQQAAAVLAATTQSRLTMNLIRQQQAAVSNANWANAQNTSRMLQQQASISRQMQATAGGFGGVTGAATQASFAIEDFVQVMSMGGGLNMALMSASNNLTMMARAFLGTSASLAVGLGIPVLLIGIGHLVSKLMEAKDKTDELQKGMERLRKTMAEEAHIQMRSETRNFESMLEEAKASADLRDKLKQINRDLAESEDKLGLAIRQGDRALEAQIAGYEEASRAIFNYYQSKIRFTKNEETIAKTQREMAVAFQIYRQAYEQLVNANITSTAQARNALSTFNFQISSIGGTEEVQKIVQDLLSGIEDGTLKEFTDIEEAMAEITKLTDQRVEAQKRMNELAEQERIDKEQNLKYTREEMLAQMRMNDVQKEMFGIQKEMEEFVGGDPNNPDWIDKAQAQKEFLMNKKAELEKQMLEETQPPPIAAKMEQNAFQAQTYAMQQVLEAQYKRPDPQKEKILQVISNIDRAIQRGGIVIDVVP